LISIDLGGTNIKITVLSNDGEIETLWSITTDTSEKGSQIISDIISSIKNKLTERNIPDSDLAPMWWSFSVLSEIWYNSTNQFLGK